MTAARVASIQARLLAYAKAHGADFQATLTRYGLERFLYRLSQTAAQETLWLKGALLFDLWFDVPHRPTRDADFLGFGPADAGKLAAAVRTACAVEVDDGMIFDADSIRVAEIREDVRYGGLRVTLQGRLGNSLCPIARSSENTSAMYSERVNCRKKAMCKICPLLVRTSRSVTGSSLNAARNSASGPRACYAIIWLRATRSTRAAYAT